MGRCRLMTVFVAVAEEQGFAAAARRLRMSPPAVTRAVVALEDHLGVRLLQRTTRVVKVTEAGAQYLEDARRILAELDEADALTAGHQANPRGELAVTAPVLFGRLYVMPIITAYRLRYEQTRVCALFVDRIVNLMEEGLDVGVRIGTLPDSSLRAVRVGQVRRVVVASPTYLAEHGTPQTPDELASHRIIAATALSPTPEWDFGGPGARNDIRVRPAILVNTNDGAIEAARAGFGLTRVLSYQVAPQIAAGELRRVLEDFEGPDWPVHVLHHEGRHRSAKVQRFVELAAERLRTEPALR